MILPQVGLLSVSQVKTATFPGLSQTWDEVQRGHSGAGGNWDGEPPRQAIARAFAPDAVRDLSHCWERYLYELWPVGSSFP